ncbi:MAG TPA: TetR/AcrR family transcriptional regulator [Allosphingosinicella sp.]|jgi:AcrR family transcriptional regulator|nr:TetR/AcrR family transcriptional regulator [Allosphingosinicella sp.]
MREQSREAILSAALDIFGEKSFAGSTTAAVAERAGVSKGLVFAYFPSKDALLQALVEKMLGEALDFWDDQPWQGTPREQLLTWADTAIAQVLRRPGFYRLYFSLALQPGGSAAVERALANLQGRLASYLCRAEGVLRAAGSQEPALDARLLQCAINGLAQVVVTSPSFTSAAGLAAVEPLRERLAALIRAYCGEGVDP